MKEELVTFETAKLAKQKGFKGFCNHYTCVGYGSIKEDKSIKNYGTPASTYFVENIDRQFHLALVPTQSLLHRWLREKHNLSVEVTIDNEYKWGVSIDEIPYQGKKCLFINDAIFPNYEQALEVGLNEALKLI